MSWCGPYWSNGQYQTSRRGYAPASSEFDETCRQHDFTYADNGDLRNADLLFARENIGRGFVRTAAGLAVGLQGVLRSVDKRIPTKTELQEEMVANTKNTRLRGAAAAAPTTNTNAVLRRGNAPVSMGTIIRQQPPRLVRAKDGATLHGTDFLNTVEGEGVADFGIGKAAMLSPAFFVGTFLGNLARSFERYRWKRLRIHYVPKVSTATAGQVILTSSKSVSEPVLNPNSGTFLQRAMSQGNASMGPLWMENFIDITCNNDWLLVDPGTTTDPDDAIAEELQVFTQTSVEGQVGYLYADYEIEFQNTIFAPHSTSLPIFTGPGLRTTLNDFNISVVGDDWQLDNPSGALSLGTMPMGTIFRGVLDIMGSNPAGSTTFANMLNVSVGYKTGAAVTSSTSLTPFPLQGGSTIYFVVIGLVVEAYATLEGAVNGIGSGQLFYRNAGSTLGTYALDLVLIRYGPTVLASTQ